MAFYQKLYRAQGVTGASLKVRMVNFDDVTHLDYTLMVPNYTPEETCQKLSIQK